MDGSDRCMPATASRVDDLASRYEPAELNRIGFRLDEKFRPDVPYGTEGWGKRAVLDMEKIRSA